MDVNGAGFQLVSAGFLCTIQDGGRYGYERFGVPASGPMDWFALRSANRLVGNDSAAAGLEFALEGPVLEARQDLLIAVTGRGFRLWVQGRRIGLWMAAWVRPGERAEVKPDEQERHGWGYLAVMGGVAAPIVLGSRSTYLRGGLGGLEGRTLQAADRLVVGGEFTARECLRLAGRRLPPDRRPAYGDEVALPVVLGPQDDDFEEDSLRTFLSTPYRVTSQSDRMGYRLAGAGLRRRSNSELLSEGMPAGSVQVAADGLPMLMMSDRPTTGGYPKIAVAARCGLPLAAQIPLGQGTLRFRAVDANEAREAYRQMIEGIESGMEG